MKSKLTADALVDRGPPQVCRPSMPFCSSRSAVHRDATTSVLFSATCLRGRPVPPSRIDDVAHHYELFNGVSPLTELTMKQAEGLRARLAASAPALPVYVGMRNWHPFLHDTLAAMSRAGVRRAIGFIMAAQGSYSSCQQYKENVRDARKAIVDAGLADIRDHLRRRLARPRSVRRRERASRTGRDRAAARRAALTRAADLHGAQHSDAAAPTSAAIASSSSSRLRRSPSGPSVPTGRSSIRAGAAVPTIPGSGPMSATICGRRAPMGSKPRCSVRSASSAITSRSCTTSTMKPQASPATWASR